MPDDSEFKDLSSVEEFLRKIAKNESSNQYFVDHPEMQHGMHRGMQAVGKYGLMPLTIAELMERRERQGLPEAPELPVGYEESPSPRSPAYRGNAMYMADQLRSNPEGQELLARQMAQDLLQKTGGDQDRAAYMWTMGHNLPVNKVTPQKMDTSDYVQKFRASSAQENPDVPQLEEQSRKKKKFKSLKGK